MPFFQHRWRFKLHDREVSIQVFDQLMNINLSLLSISEYSLDFFEHFGQYEIKSTNLCFHQLVKLELKLHHYGIIQINRIIGQFSVELSLE